MKITAITRYKQTTLFSLLRKLGWSQNQLGIRSNMTPQTIGRIMNLQRRPTLKQAEAIQRAAAEVGEFVDILAEWPETFEGLPTRFAVEQTQDVEMETLLGNPEVLRIAAPEPDESGEQDEALYSCLDTLKKQEADVLDRRFMQQQTLEEVAAAYKVTRERVRQIQAVAIRKMRHPERMRKLKREDINKYDPARKTTILS